MSDHFEAGAVVDITIRGARVISHGVTQISFTLPGLPSQTHVLPTRDARAQHVLDVAAAVPVLRAGEVYMVVATGYRLFAVDYSSQDPNSGVWLIDPLTATYYEARHAIAELGPIELIVPAEPSAPVEALPDDSVLLDPAPGFHFELKRDPAADQATDAADADATAILAPPYASVTEGAAVMLIDDGARYREEIQLHRPAGTDESLASIDDFEEWTDRLRRAGWDCAGVWRYNEVLARWQVEVRPAPPQPVDPDAVS